jgi:phosphoadenosine phosphosulfate reductase
LELQEDGLIKINPLLNWKMADVNRYIEEHDLPRHPLYEKGYRSIGCAPCTVAIGENDDERAGRWAGAVKWNVDCILICSARIMLPNQKLNSCLTRKKLIVDKTLKGTKWSPRLPHFELLNHYGNL